MRRIILALILASACGGATEGTGANGTPASVTVSPELVQFTGVGQSTALTALVRNSLSNGIAYPVQWRSSNPASISVSNSGVISVLACGGSRVTATAASVSGEAQVSVTLPGSNPATEVFAASLGVNVATMTKRSDALYQQDVTVGSGTTTAIGRQITIRQSGWLKTGVTLPSSQVSFVLNTGGVIAGLDQGIVGMRVGGKRRLVIGSALAFGAAGTSEIPCYSTLVYEIELLSST